VAAGGGRGSGGGEEAAPAGADEGGAGEGGRLRREAEEDLGEEVVVVQRRRRRRRRRRTSRATRQPARRLRGLAAHCSSASTSFTCAASRNLRPPYLTKGMPRRVISSSSAMLWCEVRKRTAWRISFRPDSRRASTESATRCACSASSATVFRRGRGPAPRALQRFFVKRSAARPITAFDASSTCGVLR